MPKFNPEAQRLNFAHITRLVQKDCDYHIYEVEDVLKAFYEVLRRELCEGKSVLIERLCRLEIKKPKSRRLYNPRTKEFYDSPAHPKLCIKPTIGLLDYIREHPDTSLVVKDGTSSKREQHHQGKQKDYYNDKKRKQARRTKEQEEFLPIPV